MRLILFLIIFVFPSSKLWAWQIRVASVFDCYLWKHDTTLNIAPSPICNKLFVLDDSFKLVGHLTAYGQKAKLNFNGTKPELKSFYWENGMEGTFHLFPLSNAMMLRKDSLVNAKTVNKSEYLWDLTHLALLKKINKKSHLPLFDSISDYQKFTYKGQFIFELKWYNDSSKTLMGERIFAGPQSSFCFENHCWTVNKVEHWLLGYINDNGLQRSVVDWELKKSAPLKKNTHKKFLGAAKVVKMKKSILVKGFRLKFIELVQLNGKILFAKVDITKGEKIIFKNLYLTKDSYFYVGSLLWKVADLLEAESSLHIWITKPF